MPIRVNIRVRVRVRRSPWMLTWRIEETPSQAPTRCGPPSRTPSRTPLGANCCMSYITRSKCNAMSQPAASSCRCPRHCIRLCQVSVSRPAPQSVPPSILHPPLPPLPAGFLENGQESSHQGCRGDLCRKRVQGCVRQIVLPSGLVRADTADGYGGRTRIWLSSPCLSRMRSHLEQRQTQI